MFLWKYEISFQKENEIFFYWSKIISSEYKQVLTFFRIHTISTTLTDIWINPLLNKAYLLY